MKDRKHSPNDTLRWLSWGDTSEGEEGLYVRNALLHSDEERKGYAMRLENITFITLLNSKSMHEKSVI